MDPKQFHRRVWALVVVLALMLTTMSAALYDLQINNGDEYYALTQHKIAEQQSMRAARGQILDRNGQVLVSNRVIYQVRLDLSLMGEERNDTLLALIQAARAEGVEWNDSLPVSRDAPFTFTTSTPYYTVSLDEEGQPQRALTRLGRLGVKLGWMSDPTKNSLPAQEEPVQEPEPGLWEKIIRFFTGSSGQKTGGSGTKSTPLSAYPTPVQLLGNMCRTFGLKGAGAVDEKEAKRNGIEIPELNIGDLDPEDARAVAGVLYELYLRSQNVYVANEYVFADEVGIDFISRVKELSLTGVVVEATTVRQYHTAYAAHLLGRTALMNAEEWEYYKTVDEDGDGVSDYRMNDVVGKQGAELAFESYLRGRPGLRTVERNTKGNIVSENWLREPEPGDNVVLTLDIGLQAYVENTLAAALPALESKEVQGAACVVLDVDSAELLASASYPTYDLANFSAVYNEIAQDPLKPLLNRAFQGMYPPGSTFKMITAIAGLEEEIVTPTTRIRDEGRYTYWGETGAPQCWIYRQLRSTHGLVNVTRAIEVSCNYFFFEVGRQLGIDTLADYAGRFGIGERTGIELSESQGVMASRAYTESLGGKWYEGSVTSVAIGQESTQVTPLQLANYIATLVNGGTRNAAHLLKEVKSNDFSQVVYTYEPRVLNTIEIQPENLAAVKKGMLDLTTGTGSLRRHFQNLPVQVGAKTGSAQISAQTESNAVFVCFAPFDDPEIAVAVVVEHGGSGGELASIAADILSYYCSFQESREEIPMENTLIR